MRRRTYDIAPKKTRYRGITFRSKIEARWAIFFDRLGWDWKYEYKRVKLPSGVYIPDFYFPDIESYAEVKPDELNELERKKCVELSERYLDKWVLLLIGSPCKDVIPTIQNGGDWVNVMPVHISNKFYPFYITDTFDYRFEHNLKAIFNQQDHNYGRIY